MSLIVFNTSSSCWKAKIDKAVSIISKGQRNIKAALLQTIYDLRSISPGTIGLEVSRILFSRSLGWIPLNFDVNGTQHGIII